MVVVQSNFEFDAQNSEELLGVLENLTRDLNNVQDRQERLDEIGVAMQLQINNGEITVKLQDTSD